MAGWRQGANRWAAFPLSGPGAWHSLFTLKVKVAHPCPTLWDPVNYTVHGILQARILDWVARSLLQGIFPTQGSNPGLPHCRRIFLPAEPPGNSPKIPTASYTAGTLLLTSLTGGDTERIPCPRLRTSRWQS